MTDEVTQNTKQGVLFSIEFVQLLLNYLSERPYKETVGLIDGIKTGNVLQEDTLIDLAALLSGNKDKLAVLRAKLYQIINGPEEVDLPPEPEHTPGEA